MLPVSSPILANSIVLSYLSHLTCPILVVLSYLSNLTCPVFLSKKCTCQNLRNSTYTPYENAPYVVACPCQLLRASALLSHLTCPISPFLAYGSGLLCLEPACCVLEYYDQKYVHHFRMQLGSIVVCGIVHCPICSLLCHTGCGNKMCTSFYMLAVAVQFSIYCLLCHTVVCNEVNIEPGPNKMCTSLTCGMGPIVGGQRR